MRKIVAYCEICYGDDEILTEATISETISISGGDYVMDLCDEHHKFWFMPFADVVTEHGMRANDVERTSARKLARAPSPTPKEHGRIKCVKPDCVWKFTRPHDMREHAKTEHAEWIAKERPDLTPEFCPLGCGTTCFGNRGIVQHMRQAHKDQYEEWKASRDESHQNSQALVLADAR